MKKNTVLVMICLLLATLIIMTAATSRPQLSTDEQDLVVESVIQTLDPEGMKESIVATVETDLIAKMKAGGFVGLASVLEVPLATLTEEPTVEPSMTATTAAEETAAVTTSAIAADVTTTADAATTAATPAATADPNVSPTPTRAWDDPADYWEGAVLQDDGTYRGLHAKFANSYGYSVGSSEDGITKEFKSRYIPNENFTVDVVFENDGSVVWPARIEMRHVSNYGEYTGHTESVISDHTGNPVKPGDKCGFSVSAHGSENLGFHTFFFKIYDADSGSAIEGGDGYFSYEAF